MSLLAKLSDYEGIDLSDRPETLSASLQVIFNMANSAPPYVHKEAVELHRVATVDGDYWRVNDVIISAHWLQNVAAIEKILLQLHCGRIVLPTNTTQLTAPVTLTISAIAISCSSVDEFMRSERATTQ